MSVNIIVVSDDVKKSDVVSDVIAEAMKSKGFTAVAVTSTLNLPTGKMEHKEGQWVELSALGAIRKTFPNFLDEPVHVRSVPLVGIDLGVPENILAGRAEGEFATIDIDKTGRGETIVCFVEDGYPPPRARHKDPATAAVIERAAMLPLKENGVMDFRQAAKELKEEGVLDKLTAPKKPGLHLVTED